LKNRITIYIMSLLDRILSIKQKLKPGIIFLIPVFLGCETSEDIGVQYDLDSDANVKFIEFTLPSSNTYIDSLRTDSENRILIGNYSDDLVGSVSAESYFTIRYFDGTLPNSRIEDDFIYDSVRFSFAAPSSVPNQTGIQSFNLHVLEDTLENLVYLRTKSEVLGDMVGTYETEVTANDTLFANFLLDDAFGNQLFESASELSTLTASTDWPSMAISPVAESNILSQISLNNDTTRVFLYITHPNGAIEEVVGNDTTFKDTTYVARFSMAPSSGVYPHYVNLTRDRSGSQFSGATENEDFDLPDGRTILDVSSGITTTYTISELSSFFDENETIIINNASILFQFEENSDQERLNNYYSFFYRNNDFFAPGIVENSFNSLIMSDNAFLRGQNIPAVSQLNDDEDGILINSTLFFQTLYRNYQNSGILEIENPITETLSPVEEFVLIGTSDVSLRRTIFSSGGVKLRIYYTEVD